MNRASLPSLKVGRDLALAEIFNCNKALIYSDQTLSIMDRESAKYEIRLLVEKHSRIVREERDIPRTPETLIDQES